MKAPGTSEPSEPSTQTNTTDDTEMMDNPAIQRFTSKLVANDIDEHISIQAHDLLIDSHCRDFISDMVTDMIDENDGLNQDITDQDLIDGIIDEAEQMFPDECIDYIHDTLIKCLSNDFKL